MPNGFGRVRGFGRGGGRGFGFRGASPAWPYVGLGRGGLPRCAYFFSGVVAPPPPYQPPFYRREPAGPRYTPFYPQMSKEEELDYLRGQAQAVKEQLEQIESRIRDLDSEQKPDKEVE